jgi:hypothetical protein
MDTFGVEIDDHLAVVAITGAGEREGLRGGRGHRPAAAFG